MSNEMKDYLYDKICDVVLDSGIVDVIKKVYSASYFAHNYVRGTKNGHTIMLAVYFDDESETWKIQKI